MKQTRTTLKALTAAYRAVLRHGILCNAIALGLIATATPAVAEYTNVSLDELYPTGTADSFIYTGNQNVTWLAENISVTEPGDGRAIEIGKNALYSATEPTLLHLGGDNTNTININTAGDGILVRTKSVVDVHANDTISITSTVNDPSYDGGVGYGALWVQNSSNPGQTDTYATANLTANQINLTNLNASAIAALSEGRVNINGNATIKGKDAIYASGLSITNINAAGDKTVKMEGDIDFRQGPNSAAPVDATVNVTLNGAESYWTGNTVLSYEKKPSDDKLQINHGATIKMTDGATWTATEVAESAEPGVATNGRYYTALKNLDVNSGNVVVNRANGIQVENLAVGANGLNISNGKMDVSKSLTSGGQIHVNSGAELNVNATDGATFANSSSNDSGGAILNEGTLTLTDSTFTGNSATNGAGGAIWNAGKLTINGGAFTNNLTTSSNKNGGAIFNSATGDGDIDIKNGTTFTGNSATNGGAIDNVNGKLGIDGAIFTGNVSSKFGGAVRIAGASDDIEISGSEFTGNYANGSQGGAIYNAATGKTLTLNNNTFSGNGKLVDGNVVTIKTTKGGALYNANTGTMKIIGGSITKNAAKDGGGAIFLQKGELSINGTSITDNMSTQGGALSSTSVFNITNATIDGNVALNENAASYFIEGPNSQGNYYSVANGVATAGQGGAIYNNVSGKTSSVTGGSMSSNVAYEGGAIYNAKGTIEIDGTTLTGNTALSRGGALVNQSATTNGAVTSIKDTTFTGNAAAGLGGAIFNSSQTLILDGSNTFSDNKSNVAWDENNNIMEYVANDIYNNGGTINIISGAGETNTFAGGIDGNGAAAKFNINGAGTVNVSNALTRNTVNVNSGELHLTKADLAGSTVNVASGATINTIDNLVNDYTDAITLKNGALVKGDIDYTAGLADKYSADSGANITYKLANALNLSGVQYGSKEIRVTNTGATVNADANFAWYNAVDGLTLTSGGMGTGTVLVSGVAGGINAAVDATNETVQEITYSANAASETFDGADNVIQNADFSIVGNGSDANSNKIVFENDMIVDGKSTLALNDIVLEKTNDEAIVNRAGGTLNIKDSRIAVNVNNYGTMVSDPTYYDAKVVNVGTASFTGDVFESGSSLTNSAIVDLNNVEFKSGSSLIGNAGNTLNLVGTGNIFNGSSTGNNVVLANGANYTGTLYDGVVDARNGGIDTITGSVSGGDLYVDANLTSGEVDTFGGTSGATIKGIKLANAGYGTEDKVELTIGEATLANDLNIDGMNYYTSVVKDGNDIVFSDKLINESNLYSKLGSWTGGNYIATSADMENVADGENYMTVGQALSALDTNLKTVSTAGTIAAGQTGFVTGDAVYNAFASQTASTVDLHNAIAAIMATDASANTKRGALGQLLMTGTVAGQNLTAYTTAEAMASLVTLTGEAMSEYDFGWDINKGLQNDLDGEGKYKIDVLNDDDVESKTVAGAINANTSAISANADAIATLNDAENVAGSVRNIAKGYADETLAAANGYTDTAIENALGAVTEGVTAVYDHAHEWAEDLLGVDVDADVETQLQTALDALAAADGTDNNLESTTIAGALHELDVTSAANAEAIETLNSDEDVDGSVKNIAKGYADAALESAKDYTDTALTNAVADGGVVDTAIDNAITAAVGENGAVATAINNATKMGTDGDDSVSMYAHFDEGASVTEAAAALDTAVSATENDIATLKGEEGTAGSVKNTAKGYADTAENNAKTFATSAVDSLANGAVADNTAALSLLNGDANTEGSVAYAAANAVATANAYTDSKLNEVRDSAVAASNAYTDRRIEDLDKNLSAGVAGAVALSSVAVSGVERGEVSVGAGYGYFNGQSAAAFGATMGLSNRWSVNAGAGISNADVSFRAGTNYKFKLF